MIMKILLISYYGALNLIDEAQLKVGSSEYVQINQIIDDINIIKILWDYSEKTKLSVRADDKGVKVLKTFFI